MRMVNTHEAKTHLSRLLDEVVGGGQIVIAKAGRPLARLVRYEDAGQPRQLGTLRDQVKESADCWDLDAELAASIDAPLYANIPCRC